MNPQGLSLYRVRRVLVTLAIVALPVVGATQGGAMRLVEVTPDKLTWTPNANGTSQAVLYGDPTKAGTYVIHVKFPPNLKLQPHFHGEDRIVTVLSGTLHFGVGETFDEKKLKTFPPRSMWTEPAKQPHFAWSMDGEVILQTVGTGPTSTTAVPAK